MLKIMLRTPGHRIHHIEQLNDHEITLRWVGGELTTVYTPQETAMVLYASRVSSPILFLGHARPILLLLLGVKSRWNPLLGVKSSVIGLIDLI